jgi:heptosyltransferase-1
VRILIIEIWGLGDAVLATGAVRSLQRDGHEVSILCKKNTRDLLFNYLSDIENWHMLECPWTSHRKKYRLWSWNWREIFSVLKSLRSYNYDMSLSIRADPREDTFALLAGIKRRIGYRRWNFWKALNDSFEGLPRGHRVEMWEKLTSYVTQANTDNTPLLVSSQETKRTVVIHVGASVAVRRWALDKIVGIVERLRDRYGAYKLELICDLDGYGSELEPYFDETHQSISLERMIEILNSADLVIGNDSGPTHIAAALGRRTVTVFGPQFSDLFRPWSAKSLVVEGKDCEYKACKDYCKFEVPHCIDDIEVDEVWEKVDLLLQTKDEKNADIRVTKPIGQ